METNIIDTETGEILWRVKSYDEETNSIEECPTEVKGIALNPCNNIGDIFMGITVKYNPIILKDNFYLTT